MTEIESGSKWHCYICKPEKFKEPRAHAKKVAESAKLHAKWVESKELDSERRKLEKFEKKKKIINEEKVDGGESTDAEDLEIKVIKLLQTLERVVEQAERPIEKKRRFSKIVSYFWNYLEILKNILGNQKPPKILVTTHQGAKNGPVDDGQWKTIDGSWFSRQ